MSNLYKPSSASATSYVRAKEIILNNGLGNKSVTISEEKLTTLDDGEVIRQPHRNKRCRESITNADMGKTIPLVNPETGESLGAEMTYAEFYTAVYSLYMKMALKRDAEVLAEQAAAEVEEFDP